MSWNDYNERKQAIAEVLNTARRNPDPTIETIPGPFADLGELLAALQHKWMQQLTGRVEVALADTEHSPHGDRVEAVTTAWRRTAEANPQLRRLLDHHADHPALRAGSAREHRVVATAAGLAEEYEPERDIARVGQAFLQLMRATPAPAAERGLGGMLRKLIPSR